MACMAHVPGSVAVVLLNWNGRNETLECMESLARVAHQPLSIIVVDNASTDGSIDAVKARFPTATVLSNKCNLGYAGGNNVGIRHALELGAEFVLVLNNDTRVAKDLICRLLVSADRHPEVGAFSPRIFYWDEPRTVWFDGAKWNEASGQMHWPGQRRSEVQLSTDDHESDYASGAAMFIRTEAIRAVGYLDERYYLVWEEADWCFRARRAGWKCLIVPTARVWHKVGVSFGSELSPLRTYFSVRNHLLWSRRHASLRAQLNIWVSMGRRLMPRFAVDSNTTLPFPKRVIWAMRDYLLAWRGKGSRFTYLATRRAVRDFLSNQFGDCPTCIRRINAAWVTQQESSTLRPVNGKLRAEGRERQPSLPDEPTVN